MDSAARLIEQLGLAAHPEGGWYRETWRGEAGPDGRAQGTAIIFLLRAGEARDGFSLVSCVVVPGFDFAGFTLAAPGWEPGA